MDLTKSYPRSVHEKLFGVVQLPRTIDKGKAAAAGTLGEYDYDCPMDKAVFAFLGMNGDALLEVIKKSKTDAEIEAYSKQFIDKKSAAEIDAWNQQWVLSGPTEGPSLEYFLNMRNELDPTRTDIIAWADLLDLDEKRTVPKREAANA